MPFTEEAHAAKQQQLLEALAETLGLITQACVLADCSRTFFYNCMKDKAFKKRYKEILQMQGDFVEGKLMESVQALSDSAIQFYLKSKRAKARGYNQPKELPTPPPKQTAEESKRPLVVFSFRKRPEPAPAPANPDNLPAIIPST